MNPRVNILLPTYEPRSEHLCQAIASVVEQTEQHWTLFIHDDASRADVRSMVEPFLADTRIAFARGKERQGIGGNWNAALQCNDIVHTEHGHLHRSAPFVQYLFQDDCWEPLYLERALAVMHKHPDVGAVSAGHRYLFEGACVMRQQYEEIAAFRRECLAPGRHDGDAFLRWWMERGLHPNVLGEPSFVLLRRSLTERTGFFSKDMPQFLDVEYWTRMLPGTTWYHLAEDLGAFRVHEGAASERNFREGRGLFDRLRCLERVLHRLPPGRDRLRAKDAIMEQLSIMIEKFRTRRERSGGVRLGGSSAVLRFVLRHPLLSWHAYRKTKNLLGDPRRTFRTKGSMR